MRVSKKVKKQGAKKKQRRAFHLYVVELEPEALKHKKLRSQSETMASDGRCLYVGMTGLTPEERFRNHKKDHKSNVLVRRYGKYLRRRLFKKYSPMSYEDALREEVSLAKKLRAKGHAVYQR